MCWDSATNKCFAAAWNIGHYNVANFSGTRNIYRIIPNPLAVDVVQGFEALFSVPIGYANLSAGVGALKAINGSIWGLGWNGALHPTAAVFKFSPTFTGPVFHQMADASYPSFAYAKIGGTNDNIFIASPDADDIEWWDFTANSFNQNAFDTTKGYMAIEYAPVQQMLYVTRELQFIDIYNTSGVFQSTVNTGRSGFNGVNIQLNPNDGLLYVAGGADNTVIVIDPSTNAVTIKTGYDLPWNFVFTPSAKFAVQQGATGLKLIT